MIAATDRSVAAAERQLLAAAERAARHPQGRLAVVLHLSGMQPPALQPHHLRIARALMHDVAQRHDGQTFALRNGDVVLLCQTALPGQGPASSPLAALPATLARLFGRDTADAAALVSVWPLVAEAPRLLAYAAARLADGATAAAADETAGPAPEMVDRLDALIAEARPADLIHRQTAVLLVNPPGSQAAGRTGLAEHLRPLYQKLSFSMDLVEARLNAPGLIERDPYLLRHLAGRLDARLLQALHDESGHGGPLDPVGCQLALHLSLTLTGLLSTAFASLALACHGVGRPLAAEVSLIEAVAEPAAFAAAREQAGRLGVTLVLSGVAHLALVLARPWLLPTDLVKLDWSPRVPDLPAPEQATLVEAIREIGAARLILQKADSETAIRWGIANGVRRFQGRQIDAMLAASRLLSCTRAAPCNLRQCQERANATGGAARASCRNHPLLDAGTAAALAAQAPTPA